MIQEFRDFIAKGNAIDLAVGIIVGSAFTAIVTSLVNDLINPLIGIFTGGIDFSNLFVVLDGSDYVSLQAARDAGAAVFAYGSFINAVIRFFIVAVVVFFLVRLVNRIKFRAEKPDDVAPEVPTGPSELDVLIEIRDRLSVPDR